MPPASPDDTTLPGPDPLAGMDVKSALAAGLGPLGGAGAPAWEPPLPEELAAVLTDYEILGVIGRGGMGAIYKGRDPQLDRIVAIKLLPPELSHQPELMERFTREARALARLDHPNIVKVHDFRRTTQGHLYFVMEYVDGVDLGRMLGNRSGGGPPGHELAATLEIIGHVCDALQYAHNKGIVHRDIKPSNVLISKDGKVKVADFGLARGVDPGDGSSGFHGAEAMTVSGMVMGTLEYMAPEQRDGQRVDHRTDIYAVGVLFYQMLTGQLPRGAFLPPSRKTGRADARLDTVVLKALQTEPEDRYQRASDLSEAVHALESPSQPLAGKPENRALGCFPVQVVVILRVGAVAAGVIVCWFLLIEPANISSTINPKTPPLETPVGRQPAQPEFTMTTPTKGQLPPNVPPAGKEWIVPGHFPTIQQAIDAAGQGQPITIKSGTFQERLVLKTGLRLTGAGQDRTIISADGLTYSTVYGKDAQDIVLDGIAFRHDGNQTSPSGRPVIDLKDCAVTFRHCAIRSGVADGLNASGEASEVRLQNCVVENNGLNGLHITLGARAELQKCEIRQNSNQGLVVDLGKATVVLEDSVLEENGGCGLEVGDDGSVQALRIKTNRNASAGWFVHDAGSRAVFDDCESMDNENGLALTKSGWAELKNCRLRNNKQTGIFATDPKWLEVTGSVVRGNQLLGLSLIAESGRSGVVRLDNNTIADSAQGGVKVEGQGLKVELLNNKIGPNGLFDVYFWKGSAGTVTGNTFLSREGLAFEDDTTIDARENRHPGAAP